MSLESTQFCLSPSCALTRSWNGVPRQRVRDRDPDVVGPALAHHLQRERDVLPALARIPELQEEAHLDARIVKQPRRHRNLFHARSLLHRVEDPLRAGFGTHPDRPAAGGAKRGDGPRSDLVRPQQTLERDDDVARAHLLGEPLDPTWLQSEDVVGDPQMVGLIRALQPRHLVDDRFGRAGRSTAVRRSASRTSCSETGSRGSSPRSWSSSRAGEAICHGSVRRRRDPTRGTAARRDRG